MSPIDAKSSRWASRARNVRALADAMRGDQRVGYLGWLGYENIGDEVLFEVADELTGGARLRHLPVPTTFGRVARRCPWSPVDVLVLGGGTLVGHEEQRRPFEDLWSRHPDVPAFTFGTGVEDPARDRAGVSEADRWAELRRWKPVLERFRRVTVRGPLSAAILAEVGIGADVVGDPALVLGEGIRRDVRPRLLGLNLGRSGSQWGADPEATQDAVVGTLRGLLQDGWNVRAFPMAPDDEPDLEALQRRCGTNFEVVRGLGRTPYLLQQMAECTTFLGFRLHATILAASVEVPTVALEYLPKCRDFHASIGREPFTVRTDEADAGHLRELLDECAAQRDAQVLDLRAHLHRHRETLHQLGADIEKAAAA